MAHTLLAIVGLFAAVSLIVLGRDFRRMQYTIYGLVIVALTGWYWFS